MWNMKAMWWTVLKSQYNEGTTFFTKVILLTLTSLLNVNRDHVSIKTIQHVKYKSSVINSSQNNKRNSVLSIFYKSDHCDLDRWPRELKIHKGLVLIKTNQHVKYKSYIIKSFQDNDRKPFSLPTDGPSDRPTDRPIDISKTVCPLFFEGVGA